MASNGRTSVIPKTSTSTIRKIGRSDLAGFVSDAPFAGVLHQPDVLGKRATLCLVRRHRPGLSPRGQLLCRELNLDQIVLRIDRDPLAGTDERNRSAFL